MPIYEYKCTTCSHSFEVFAKMSDAPPIACDECGAQTIEKVMHPVGIHYKGSGFYATDYGKSGSKGRGGDSSNSASSESGSGSSSGGSDGGSSSGSSGSSDGSSSGSSSGSGSKSGSSDGGSGSSGSSSGSGSSSSGS